MAILVELKPEVEARLQAEADEKGLPVSELAGRLIAEHAAAPPATTHEELYRCLMRPADECRALPSLDGRAADEIVGYDGNGLPYL